MTREKTILEICLGFSVVLYGKIWTNFWPTPYVKFKCQGPQIKLY